MFLIKLALFYIFYTFVSFRPFFPVRPRHNVVVRHHSLLGLGEVPPLPVADLCPASDNGSDREVQSSIPLISLEMNQGRVYYPTVFVPLLT